MNIKALLILATSILSQTSFAQVTIWSEDFSHPDGTMEVPGMWTSMWTDCDDGDINMGNNQFGVFGGEFVVNDIEGGPCCSPGGANRNYIETVAIDISNYCNVSFSLLAGSPDPDQLEPDDLADVDSIFSCTGDGFIDNGHDQIVVRYFIDGVAFDGPLVAGAFGLGTLSVTDITGNSLVIRIYIANKANAEFYTIDDLIVEGDPADTVNLILPDNTFCTGAAPVNLNTNQDGFAGSWSGPGVSGNQFDPSSAGSGSHILNFTPDAGQCASEADTTVTVISEPVIDALSDTTSCDSYTLPAISGSNLNSPAYYTASGGGGTMFEAGDAITSSHTPLYIYDETGGCSDEESFNVTIVASPDLSPISDTTVCDVIILPPIQGSMLSGNEAYYEGPGGSGQMHEAGDVFTSNITLYVYDSIMGCEDEVQFDITVEDSPTANPASLQTCAAGGGMGTFDLTDANSTVNGGSGETVLWYEDMALNNPIGTPSNYTSGSGTVYAVVDNGTCTSAPSAVDLEVLAADLGAFELYCGAPGVDSCKVCDQDYNSDPSESVDIMVTPAANLCFVIEIDEAGVGIITDTICNTDILSTTISGDASFQLIEVYDPSSGCVDTDSLGDPVQWDYFIQPDLDLPADVNSCDYYVLPPITGSELDGSEAYYSQSGGAGTVYQEGDTIFTSTTLFIFGGISGCSDEHSFDITINSAEDASFDFPDFCLNESNGPQNIATAGGSFSFSPPPADGALIDPATGVIDNESAGSTYSVKYVTGGACPDSSTVNVTVFGLPSYMLDSVNCSTDLTTYSIYLSSDAAQVVSSAGNVTDNGDGTWTIGDVPEGTGVNLTLISDAGDCERIESVSSPDCSCPTIDPPLSEGDTTVCEGEPIPPLSVATSPGLEVDWYDAPSGGMLLQQNSTTYTPSSAGTYYAENRDPANDCTSNTRTGVTLTIVDAPTWTLDSIDCLGGTTTYFVELTTTADSVSSTAGNVVFNGGDSYTIEGIPDGTTISIIFVNTVTGCQSNTIVNGLVCDPCDPPIPPPTSEGDTSVCEGEPLPELSVSVADPDWTTNWYDAPAGGNLLLMGSLAFTPATPGTYWAETLDPNTGCVSASRTGISLTVIDDPTFTLMGSQCAPDLNSWMIDLSTSADQIDHNQGTLADNGDGTYTVSDIPINSSVTLIFTDSNTGCSAEITAAAPPCNCPPINPPVSTGDVSICEAEPLPELEVIVDAGLTADWYDSPAGGVPLVTGSTTYSPSAPGTYYAEARDPDTDCVSDTRTAITISIDPLPVFDILNVECGAAGDLYFIDLTTSADQLAASPGDVTDNGGGSFLVENITEGVPSLLTFTNSTTGCEAGTIVNSPGCAGCTPPPAPVSDGDTSICENENIPLLSVSVADPGYTVDWYDAASGGTLLEQGSLSYQPTAAGTYYAETYNPAEDCYSDSRTPVTLEILALPTFTADSFECLIAGGTYDLYFSSDADTLHSSEGTVTSLGGGNWTATDIPNATDVTIFLFSAAGCTDSMLVSAPDCSCPDIPAPISGGDTTICDGSAIPALVASAADSLLIDWYDEAFDGMLLAMGTDTFTPSAGGTYYAEARDTASDCTSNTRTAISLTIADDPSFFLDSTLCLTDPPGSWTAYITTDADSIAPGEGVLVQTGVNRYEIQDLPLSQNVSVILFSDSGCADNTTLTAPDCSCPPIDPPVSGGDETICEDNPLPTLVATADSGLTVNWYDSATGGNLLLSNSPFFNPPAGGTYYAEAVDSTDGCFSTRTPVTLTVSEFPTIIRDSFNCVDQNDTYTLFIRTSGDTLYGEFGLFTEVAEGEWVVINIPQDSFLFISAVNAEGCTTITTIPPPLCEDCPDISAPLSGGDRTICLDELPEFVTATADSGQLIDWYDADSGGMRLAAGTDTLLVTGPGSYYAESRDTATGCISDMRTQVTLTVDSLPLLELVDIRCDSNFQTYSAVVYTTADSIEINAGLLAQISFDTFLITSVDTADILIIAALDTASGCNSTLALLAPDCECTGLEPPVSLGDTSYCEGEDIPALAATPIEPNSVIDWYDSASGGSLLLSGSNTFVPPGPGTYYVERRDTINNCSSGQPRVAITLTQNPLPQAEIREPECSADISYYSISFFSDALLINVNAGSVTDSMSGAWLIDSVPIGQNLMFTIADSTTDCQNTYVITPPDCDCPDIPAPVSVGDQSICAGDAIPALQATAVGGLTVNWYDSASGGNLLLANSDTFVPPGAGTFYAGAYDSTADCRSDQRTTVSLSIAPLPEVDAGEDAQVCGLATTLGGQADGSLQWTSASPEISFEDPTAPNSGIEAATSGSYEIVLSTTLNACNASDSLTVTFTDQIRDSIAFTSCSGQSINYRGELFDEDRPSGELIIPGQGSDCDTLRFVEVTFEMVEVDYETSTPPCFEENGHIVIFEVMGAAPYTIIIDGGLEIPLGPFPAVFQLSAGLHNIQVIDANGCQAELEVEITQGSPATLDLGPDQNIEAGSSTVINVQTNIDPQQFIWMPSSSVLTPNSLQATVQPDSSTLYSLTVVDSNGCEATDSVFIEVNVNLRIYIPNAFTPNGDGVNDYFKPYGSADFPILNFEIYNRWGDRVFQRQLVKSTNIQGWDGRFGDKDASQGVYAYILEVGLPDGTSRFYSGELTLIR